MQAAPTSSSPELSPVTSEVADFRSGSLSIWNFAVQPTLIPLVVVAGYYLAQNVHPLLVLLTPLLVFGWIPLLDFLVGTDTFNATESTLKRMAEEKGYRYITWAYVPLQALLLLWACWELSVSQLSWGALLGFALSFGILSGGLGITFAHELCHKSNRLEQQLGKTLLAMVCYMHFAIEHNLGHHVNVATYKDPASSRLGESFYRFYPRTVWGSFRSAWQLEARRLSRLHLSVWSRENQMIWFVLIPLALGGGLGLVFGLPALVFFFAQSVVAFSLLEIVNYLEHYGLERREVAPGKFERVSPLHSWNSNNRVTNGFLIMLQRHSDHHANAQRRYQTLRHFERAPQLPTGYAGMVMLALLPPLWFKVMDPRVHAFRAQLAAEGKAEE